MAEEMRELEVRRGLAISGPVLESLNGKCQSFPGEWSRKLQTNRTMRLEFFAACHREALALFILAP